MALINSHSRIVHESDKNGKIKSGGVEIEGKQTVNEQRSRILKKMKLIESDE